MTISTTTNTVTLQGDGSNTNWPFSFLIPTGSLVVTLTEIATGETEVLSDAVYSATGLDNPDGGSVTYPLSGSPLTSAYNLTVQRILPLTQETNLSNQGAFNPEVVEDEFDNLVMLIQQLEEQVGRALAFPVGATDTSAQDLIEDIINGAANAQAAQEAADAAEAAAATVEGLLPIDTANIADEAVTTAKIDDGAVTALKLAQNAMSQVTNQLNASYVASVAAGALTIALKTLAGADPSASDPVRFFFRNVTAGNAGTEVVEVTAALSLVISAGSTLGFSSATAGRLWLVVFNDGGVPRLGVINCLSSLDIYPLLGWGIASSTAEGGAGGADSAHVFYTGTAVTAKAFSLLAYLTWETGLTTAGTWDATPTRIQQYSFGSATPGMLVQKKLTTSGTYANGTTQTPLDDTIPQNTEGEERLTQAITPTSAANVLMVEARLLMSSNQGSCVAALFQDTTADAVAAQGSTTTTAYQSSFVLVYQKRAGQTTATTFKARVGQQGAGANYINGSSSARLFGGVSNSYMKVEEIMA